MVGGVSSSLPRWVTDPDIKSGTAEKGNFSKLNGIISPMHGSHRNIGGRFSTDKYDDRNIAP